MDQQRSAPSPRVVEVRVPRARRSPAKAAPPAVAEVRRLKPTSRPPFATGVAMRTSIVRKGR